MYRNPHIVTGSDPVDVQIPECENVALPLATLWCYVPQRPTEKRVGLVPGRPATFDRPAIHQHLIPFEQYLTNSQTNGALLRVVQIHLQRVEMGVLRIPQAQGLFVRVPQDESGRHSCLRS